MTAEQKRAGDEVEGSGETESPAEQTGDEGGDDSCRCKEVSKKTIPQMLKLMIKDLAFWKKVH
jgi:hypothetical protein